MLLELLESFLNKLNEETDGPCEVGGHGHEEGEQGVHSPKEGAPEDGVHAHTVHAQLGDAVAVAAEQGVECEDGHHCL